MKHRQQKIEPVQLTHTSVSCSDVKSRELTPQIPAFAEVREGLATPVGAAAGEPVMFRRRALIDVVNQH
jgi:hypothetical protein